MSKTITLYTKDNCRMCWASKRKLDSLGATYAMRAVDLPTVESMQDLEALRAEGYQEMPVVIVQHGDGSQSSWSGYRPNLIEEYCRPEEKAA
ncbi:glutaredoxin domain-containing protein [Citricoccus sp. K5]|uniref:glutaredoxin domain-containing protein n=1 Tax=Citricoccus sp. K5 TaxID=2653135 RepID=UPI0012F0A602|nr:glutaredoxin domain-containing protein [Citricoccus sp. K5]VXB24099.1 Glutaredoxin-like protein NrdH [Citricoccus sp. K5]